MDKPYKDSMEFKKALAKQMKAAGVEDLKYIPMCDDVNCKACKKKKDEKAPWNI